MLQVHFLFTRAHQACSQAKCRALQDQLERADVLNGKYANGVAFAGSQEIIFNTLRKGLRADREAPTAAAIGSMEEGSALTPPIVCYPVGRVQSAFHEPANVDAMIRSKAKVVIFPDFQAAMQGLVVGERYLVLFGFHQSTGFDLLQHPRGDTSQAKRGVFTLRSPHRPNAIGVSEVTVRSVDNHSITVTGLDAIHGSPVLDIKPLRHGTSLPA